eukprot:5619420-Pleurochrysis_carterae.AAC.1
MNVLATFIRIFQPPVQSYNLRPELLQPSSEISATFDLKFCNLRLRIMIYAATFAYKRERTHAMRGEANACCDTRRSRAGAVSSSPSLRKLLQMPLNMDVISYADALELQHSDLTLTDVGAVSVGDCYAINWRAKVTAPRKVCVLTRKMKNFFQVWDADGEKLLETYMYGVESNGAPLDGSVQSEWGTTLQFPLPRVLTPYGLVQSKVRSILSNVVAQFANNNPPESVQPSPPSNPPLHPKNDKLTGADGAEEKGTKIFPAPNADSQTLPQEGQRCGIKVAATGPVE